MNELKIPKTDAEIKEILCKQLALLAERSENCDNQEIVHVTNAMCYVLNALKEEF